MSIDLEALKQAINAEPSPPCTSCLWAEQCIDPDICTQFKYFVEVGGSIAPPKEPPKPCKQIF